MIRIGIGLSVVVLAGFAAMAAVDPRGEPAVAAVAMGGGGPGSAAPSLPSWHPPVLPDGHPGVLPPGHPPILPEGHPPIAGDALTCPGGGMLPGRAPEGDAIKPAEALRLIST